MANLTNIANSKNKARNIPGRIYKKIIFTYLVLFISKASFEFATSLLKDSFTIWGKRWQNCGA